MGSTSFWQDELNLSATTDTDKARLAVHPLEGPSETEVAIIGAGITGAAVALDLARAGVAVRVLEGRYIAAGASGRNGGFITSSTTEKYSTVVARYGREQARRLWNFHVSNAKIAASIIEELDQAGWQCGYRHAGFLSLAASEKELDDIAATVSLLNSDGWNAQTLQRHELPKRLQGAYYGGSYHPDGGEIQPARFVAGLVLLAQRAGAIFHDQSPVITLTKGEDGIVLNTPRGSVRARTLVLATNAWLPEIGIQLGADWLARCITPTRGQVIATEPVDEQLFPYPCSANEGYQYWRQLDSGRLIVGGWRNSSFATEITTNETPGIEVQQHLDAFVHSTLGLPETRIDARWAGIMAFSTDSLPLVGELPGSKNCYISGGYTGHGNASALQAAQIISYLIRGKTHPDADLFDPARFV